MRPPLGCLLLLFGCASAQIDAEATRRSQQMRVAHQAAARHAPDLFDHYERAARAALSEKPESAAREDYERAMQAWLDAAHAEAERVQLSEARSSLEREGQELDKSASTLEQARDALALEAAHQTAREHAVDEGMLTLTRARLSSQQRAKAGTEEVERTARALLVRATLVEEALRSVATVPKPLEHKLDAARALLGRSPDEALQLADAAFFQALAAFSEVRGQAGPVSEAERSTLVEALSLASGELVRTERGLRVTLGRAFLGARLEPGSKRVLGRWCALAQAHARGAIALTFPAQPVAQAQARAQSLREQLSQAGCAGSRFAVEGEGTQADQLEMTWLGY